MSKINILDKDVYNKIAAGEVVEKPASVVKELVENSIDAGAKNITIEILDGGITKIAVSDDGCGISLDDFDKVFLAHATSKVKNVDDLSQIGTLGFRGEALSSISSVSKIKLSSKTYEDEIGYQVKCDGGEMGELQPIGATPGTHIVVEELFYNIPARKKFLRKPKLEENDISNYIARLILANPDISIKYIADNKIVYQSFGNGLYESIYTIYGKSIVDNLIEVDFKKDNFHFSGYIGKPTFSKANRTYQTLIINGRYVVNQTISTAIYKAFENFIMKGTFPFFVLNLSIPLDKVDVNVHPNKLDVKFEDSNQIFGIVYSSITDILYNINNTKTIVMENNTEIVDSDKLQNFSNIGSEYTSSNNIAQHINLKQSLEDNSIKEVELSDNNDENNNEREYESNKIDNELKEFKQNISSNIDDKIIPFFTSSTLDFKLCQNKELMETNESENDDTETYKLHSISNQIVIEDASSEKKYKVIGTLFDTYILIEKDNNMLLIDQHAGHERLLFDKFTEELRNKQVAIQPLLIPHIVECNYIEHNYISENIDLLNEMGFDISDFGSNSYKISSVPLLFEDININEFFDNVFKDLDNKLILSKNESIKEYIAKKACKSAIKGNDKLSDGEIDYLVSEIFDPSTVLLCPHGRPIITSVSKNEIEKWFKRIV